MSSVALKKEIFDWALKRQGLSLDAIREKFAKVDDWIRGTSNPTFKQLESLAKATHTPFGFFFLDSPPQESLAIPHFRTLDDKSPHGTSVDLLETVQQMEQRQAWVREYLVDHGDDPLQFVGSCKVNEPPTVVAQKIRIALNLEPAWAEEHSTWTSALDALREAMESVGILVFTNGIVGNNTHRKLSTEEFRGFVLVDEYAPLVFVNGSDAKAAQMFTLAHELAHVFVGASAAFDLKGLESADDPTERACNAIAAEFLAPEKEFREAWKSFSGSKTPFEQLAKRFKVSSLVAARRGLDLQLVTKKRFFEFYTEYLNREGRKAKKSSGGDFYATQGLRIGKRFGRVVTDAVNSGKLSFSEAYRLTGLHGKTFARFAKSFGGKS